MATVQGVQRTRDGALICERLEWGASFLERFMGLMGRASLPAGNGLYLATASIHMFFMRFPIDALFVSKAGPDGTRLVVGVREDLPPWRGIVLPVADAEGVVELPAGTLQRYGTAVGDEVTFGPAAPVHDEVSRR